jgi:hypothetical protein
MIHERENISMEFPNGSSMRSSLNQLLIIDCTTMSKLLRELEELEAEDKEQV